MYNYIFTKNHIGVYITRVYKVIVNSIFSELELRISILSVSIYYGIQSDIRVKSYCRLYLIRASVFNLDHTSINYDTLSGIRVKSYCCLNFLRVSVFNLERLDILHDSTGHPCIKLLSIQFSQSIGSKF